MTRLALKDELLDAQLLRTVGAAVSGGADIGECIATARRIRSTDLSSWYDEWTATAQRLVTQGEAAQAGGQDVSARSAFFRASSYFRTAGVMLMGTPVDERLVESNVRQTDAFCRGARLLDMPPETIAIPYEDTSLPGYFFTSGHEARPRPTVILTGGYDGTAEELYFFTGAAALARGYNVLTFDGPGQGAALLQQRLVLRPDWEAVIGPVIDFAIRRPDVDGDRIALIGLSLGAHLAPRAASVERRLAACIVDCGSYDLYASAIERIPGPLARAFADQRPRAVALVTRLLAFLATKPTAGWVLRRGRLVHGVGDPVSYINALRDFTLDGRAANITCPMFVCNAENDDIGSSAPKLVAALTCPKEFVTFTAADGAGDHCEAGARTAFHARAFDWLDGVLGHGG
jgi:pimeloyl-ACP methyl ester carboxylesterase